MNEIQEVKEVLSVWQWEARCQEDPRRLYAFLLCTDEHESFVSYVQKAWRTLDALSGRFCDVFTFEKCGIPEQRFESRGYVQLPGSRYGSGGRIVNGADYGFSDSKIAIDNGVTLPDRALCVKVRDTLFTNSRDIVLPGLAVFPSIYSKQVSYYNCSGLSDVALSEMFQAVFASVQEVYFQSDNAVENFRAFERSERLRRIRSRLTKAVLNLSLKDLYDVFAGGLKLIMPGKKSDAP